MPDTRTRPPPADDFASRHIGPSPDDQQEMLAALGFQSMEAFLEATLPPSIRLQRPLRLPEPCSEYEALRELRELARRNRVFRSLIGMGYYDTITPAVIQRNILENPGWYTQYTPYQAEISQGRLEALLNFQTMVADLTGLALANASLLDEATAAAEAMCMCQTIAGEDGARRAFFVARDCHPQTIAVVQTRARPLGIQVVVDDPQELLSWLAASEQQSPAAEGITRGPAEGGCTAEGGCATPTAEGGRTAEGGCDTRPPAEAFFGVLLQYPTTDGRIEHYDPLVERAHRAGALVVVATDLLALTLLRPPGEWGADIAVGSSQRFGVPLGYGGPHAAFLATREAYKRQVPGRIVGVSRDASGAPALRLALQTREQHIRREKATSNICTAQVLPAIVASMYAVYHGPQGLRRIARRVHAHAAMLAEGLRRGGHELLTPVFFDTLRVRPGSVAGGTAAVRARAEQRGLNLRYYEDGTVGVALDETADDRLVGEVLSCFGDGAESRVDQQELLSAAALEWPVPPARTTRFLTHPVFNSYHAEHEMLRYIKRLEARDLSLTTSMIPLGSCTMKLNAAAEMLPMSWPEFAGLHPFAPAEQAAGYHELFRDLESWLAEITGLPYVSLQPNAGSQGEYAGLLAIRAYHEHRGQGQRNVCLIPASAHGTNPASAAAAGLRVVTVRCNERGDIDLADLRARAAEHAERLAALMVTYPSTHGVFEEGIREICQIVHEHGGQVYMDGANMNAQVGLMRPGEIGADVCHLNLHKTFCIPHGGGGPGMGPIAVADHLAPFLPGHPVDVWHSRPPVDVWHSRPPVDVWHSRPRLCDSEGSQPLSAGSAQERTPARPTVPMYQRNLPHIQKEGRPIFVTFRTYRNWVLPESVRDRVLEHCLHDHGLKMWLHVAVVMPDHVHLIFTPLEDDGGHPYGLAEILNGIKGASAHTVNRQLGRKGHVWQDESFDHVLRSDESLQEKVEYVCQNPVRKGIANRPEEYRWLWCEWLHASEAQPRAAVPHTQPRAAVPHTQPGAAGPHAQPRAAVPHVHRGAAVPHAAWPHSAGPHVGPVAAAPYGSPSILPISWMYIRMMGAAGLRRASEVAILNANYMAERLRPHYPIVYTGRHGRVAHEFILDCRPIEHSVGVKVEDIAKRLMDYGFHAPTMSWPVPGTLMIEPTESESKAELDRFCDALIAIRREIREIELGRLSREDNPLRNAPHTTAMVTAEEWRHPYSREQAAFPAPWVREHKFWPAVARIDNAWGDRHLFCTCPPVPAEVPCET